MAIGIRFLRFYIIVIELLLDVTRMVAIIVKSSMSDMLRANDVSCSCMTSYCRQKTTKVFYIIAMRTHDITGNSYTS